MKFVDWLAPSLNFSLVRAINIRMQKNALNATLIIEQVQSLELDIVLVSATVKIAELEICRQVASPCVV